MRRRQWWTWLGDGVLVLVGALAAAGLVVGLGWGEHGGWRLVPFAAVGLVAAGVVCELPAAPVRGGGGAVSADVPRLFTGHGSPGESRL
ncbi:hypothetical protein AB0I51_43890 [Streptomyces sp. NPDC050549]|uniref:hypothetical protein n=1 Tax=Streptomyces sp. NPDC050549 TaxID=3155406 RepID=UPI00342F7992